MKKLKSKMKIFADADFHKDITELNSAELHTVVADVVMAEIADAWKKTEKKNLNRRRAYYFSAEFLVGRAVFNNLMCTKLYDEVKDVLEQLGSDISCLEDIEDAALGNGGLGRLAACFLDSAATYEIPLDGYGIRYKFGLFKQFFENGFQKEEIDDWTRYGDPWSVRKEEDAVTVNYKDGIVKAIPYDMPIIGYGGKYISTLRLWQAEPESEFDFELFNEQKYEKSVSKKNNAEDISRVLYPNDSTISGKILRFKQQYFFSSASLQDIIKRFKKIHGNDFKKLSDFITIQLNDTHPAVSIPELIRLLEIEGVDFDTALEITKKVFNYTNHTIMQEALEKWDLKLIKKVNPDVAKLIERISKYFEKELEEYELSDNQKKQLMIIQNNTVHMAYLSCYCSGYINGVAKIHSEILKKDVLKEWYKIIPSKFQNKTNGVTQRRWLKLANPGLASLLTKLLKNEDWITNLSELKKLEKYSEDKSVLNEFISIKKQCRKNLSEYVLKHEGISFNPDWIVDVQVKRLHEYKRQLLNILAIVELYFEIKEKSLKEFNPTVFIFGAKSAPGYIRAKGIIKLINEVSKMIASDPVVSKYIQVIFVSNYNVSYAEKIIAAADVSEQISTAGTEASGTGNMKLMLNGAVTLGTYDGANIEIVNAAGKENNYVFGAKVEELEKIKNTYSSIKIYKENKKIKRCLDILIDGTVSDDGTGMFKELYDSILNGTSWHNPDHYFVLEDFEDFVKTKKKVNRDSRDTFSFAKKGWLNMCNSGGFSSDRTIKEYALEIWKL